MYDTILIPTDGTSDAEMGAKHGAEMAAALGGEVAEMCSAEGAECVSATKVGPYVHQEVNEYVENHDIDAIVMGSGYQGRLAGLLGSTAEKILRTSEVPVTIVRRGERK
jgi:nucleotide-binding universal stress UspA family protein